MSRAKKYDEENISQRPAIELLESLEYNYVPPNEAEKMRGQAYNVILRDVLWEQLERMNEYEYKGEYYPFSRKNIERAIKEIDEPLTDGLVKANEKIYDHLMLGRSFQESTPDGNIKSFPLYYIDWDTPENNVFHVVEEFSVEREDGRGHCRPDIVLFVNGIPLAVIECKSSSIAIAQGIEQTIRNQGKDYIPQLFKYSQILMATNKNETKYATCNTPKRYWTHWREEEQEWLEEVLKRHVSRRKPTQQDKTIISLFSPQRFLDFIKFFTIFDKDEKKIARYQQYFAVKEILKSVKTFDEEGKRKGGVIWHTQGSGKSLTMVMLARYLLSDPEIDNPRVVLVTDRIELDKQIRDTFKHTRLKPNRASTGAKLVELLKNENADIITTLVHKFDNAARQRTRLESRDIFVMVDESHRTQYGELHIKMRKVFPNACYLGFTGTPLMKKEKNTMIHFGQDPRPIHTYTIADGVRDNTIVPLLYEGKMVEQTVNRKAIDNRLEIITRHLNEKQKEDVKNQWSRFERIASSNQRIQLIAFDINKHFVDHYKTQNNQFKAMLATNSKKEAIEYLEAFEDLGDLNVAVVISPPDQREGYEVVDEESKKKVNRYWERMMRRYANEQEYEGSIRERFKHGDIDLLIVVDKLLTGFDAPKATVLYIDKQLKEHSLLQAIARVNRVYEGKDFGYIVDYRGLVKELDTAMNMYSGAGLEEFDQGELEGAMYDVASTVGSLREAHSQLWQIFASVEGRDDSEALEEVLADEETREQFYDTLSCFGRYLGIALESEKVYNSLDPKEMENYKKDLRFFQKLRKSVKLRFSDGVDHKEYEAKMQNLMDTYIASEDVIRITKPVDILDEKGFERELERLHTPRAKADAIRTRLTQRIDKQWDENPAFYKKFSQRIEETLEEYKEARISESDYLREMKSIMEDFRGGDTSIEYPDNVRNKETAKAFYGVAKEVIQRKNETYDEYTEIGELAKNMDQVVRENTKVDWYDNQDVHNQIEQEIDDILFDFKYKKGVDLSVDDIDEIIELIKTVAMRRY